MPHASRPPIARPLPPLSAGRFAALLLAALVGASLPAAAQPAPDASGAEAPLADTPLADARLLRAQLLYDDAAPAVRPDDPWLGRDKVQHVVFSFLWTVGTQYTLVNKFDAGEYRALPFSVLSGAGIGLAKEVWDWQRSPSRYFSRRDLAADALGVALAVGLILI